LQKQSVQLSKKGPYGIYENCGPEVTASVNIHPCPDYMYIIFSSPRSQYFDTSATSNKRRFSIECFDVRLLWFDN